MEMNTQVQNLYQRVKEQIVASDTFEDVQRKISVFSASLSLPADVTERVIETFRSELAPSARGDSTPRLLVDWGEMPRVGHQARPEFSLICPAHKSRPEVDVIVDRELDHDRNRPRRQLQSEESGLWSFHVPFCMISGGLDCRPGQYLIQVDVAFRDVPPDLPRFYRCSIRLNVSSVAAAERGVLEIDGDGQCAINLVGYNLQQFSKVILKGGHDGLINLQNPHWHSDPTVAPIPARPATTFEYQLKVNQEKQSRIPKLAPATKPRAYLDAAGFFFEDGRRTIVVSRRSITFGRSRDNDVTLRFLPPGEENDGHSRNISRTHFVAELTPEGIELRDESRSGIEVNNSLVDKRYVVPTHWAGDVNYVSLGAMGTVPKAFELEMTLFAPAVDAGHEERRQCDELICEIVGGRLSRLAREALDAGLDAVRYDRVTTLSGEESYVHLLREALIGGSSAQACVVLRESGPQTQARLLHIDRSFWLEPLPGCLPVTVDGTLVPPLSLVALSPGMEIRFGNEIARFDRPSQLYLDS